MAAAELIHTRPISVLHCNPSSTLTHRAFPPLDGVSTLASRKAPPGLCDPKMLRSLPSNDVGERLVASYVNFYLANGAVILPGFGVPEDESALRLFEVRAHTRDCVRFH